MMPGPSITQVLVLLLCWTVYGAIHSLLASQGTKDAVRRRWPGAMRGYRLAFNLVSVVLLLPPLWLSHAWRGPLLWTWPAPLGWAADALALAALAGFVWTSRHYAMGSFTGLTQWRSGTNAEARERLKISPIHRYVRHPWYFFALVLLWTREMDAAQLTGTLCITAYLVIGSRLEERKLVTQYGRAYADYRRRVGGLLPRPGRILSKAEAAALEALDVNDL